MARAWPRSSLVAVVGVPSPRARVRRIDLVWLAAFLVPAVASQRAVGVVGARRPGRGRRMGRGAGGQRHRSAPGPGCALRAIVVATLASSPSSRSRGGEAARPLRRRAPTGSPARWRRIAVGHRRDGVPAVVVVDRASRLPAQPVYVDARIELFPADVWGALRRLLVGYRSGVLEATGAQAVAGPASWAPVGGGPRRSGMGDRVRRGRRGRRRARGATRRRRRRRDLSGWRCGSPRAGCRRRASRRSGRGAS